METEDGGGPWLDPHHRRKKEVHVGKESNAIVTKFFVSNLPQGCTPWEVSEFVKVFGDVHGVYIARKKDKYGNRFGFISFKNVRDVKDMVRALNGTKMGDSKLRVNVAKFTVENSGRSDLLPQDKGKGIAKEPPGVANQTSGRSHAFVNQGGGRLFSDLFKKEPARNGSSADALQEDYACSSKVVVVPDRTSAFKNCYGVSVVGRTVDLETLVDFDKLLRIAKIKVAKIQYLGGLSILITFLDEDSAKRFLESREVWGPWFSKLESWKGQSLPLERLAWLNLVGIPLQLLEEDVFVMIGERFGKVLHYPKSLDDDQDLSVVRVGILAGEVNRINEVLSLAWKNKNYRIWVEEEQDAWVPDCLGKSSYLSQNSDSESPMNSSPVISRPEPVIRREDEPVQLGKMGGDGETPVDVGYGSSHANLDSLHEERESDGVGSRSKKLGGGSYPHEQHVPQNKEGGGQQVMR
ncbi:putative RNA recognition motif domain, nucleotide-binding alpha-beta plait domain superfamily [Helianthus annuus]|nr:putative RNA recognition motif domain, nucleotide-binding alpha-beta plait domain superfamily [Helianthus annuus]